MMASNDPVPPRRSPGTGGRRWPTILLVSLVAAFVISRALAGYYTDYLWFVSTGYETVWVTQFLAGLVIFVTAAAVSFLFMWGNIFLAEKFSPGYIVFSSDDGGTPERLGGWLQPRVRRLFIILAAAFAFLNGTAATVWTDRVLHNIHARPFGLADPQFGIDVGFYVFSLPLWQDVISWLFQVVVLSGLLALTVHYVNGSIRIAPGERLYVAPGARAHLSILLACLALVRAASYFLDQYGLLVDRRPTEFVFGAGATDVDVRIPALRLLALVAVATAVALVVNIRLRGWTVPLVSVGLWLVVGLVLGSVVPSLWQRFVVEPDEFDREMTFIQRQMEFTRTAYGLDAVETRQFSGQPDLTAEDIAANRETIDNVRVWDPPVKASTYDQQQALRPYYELGDVDVDRYRLGDDTRQVMLASREVDVSGLSNRTWVIDHLSYTHGYGSVVSTAADIVNGRPNYLVSDVPPRTEHAELEVSGEGNRIYFGETYDPASFVVVGSRTEEVDYPLDSDLTSYTSYRGVGDVSIGNVFRRALFALRYSDFNLLISPQIGPDARILTQRNVQQRVASVAPFFDQDSDPYLVHLDGRLVWVIDLYTTSTSYPYAEVARTGRLPVGTSGFNNLTNDFNYIRNSAKATVDAESGAIEVYIVDETDPIALAQQAIFPGVYKTAADIPESFEAHWRYPEDLFRVQSDMWAEYHVAVSQTAQFYNSEDLWAIANDPADFTASGIQRERLRGGDVNRPMVPYYLLMSLPEEDHLSFVILQPFNPRSRPNMQAFLIAKSDPGEYGQLVDYRLSRQTQVAGIGQVKANIEADSVISQQIALWSQQGSQVIQGNIYVVPIEESFIYVQSLYLQSETEQFPELERVIVVYGTEIVLAENLDIGLRQLFGDDIGAETPPPPDTDDPDDPDEALPEGAQQLLEAIDEAFAAAEQALTDGDLGAYQRHIDEAQRLYEDLAQLVREASE